MCTIGTASADQIAEKVQVDVEENEAGNWTPSSCELGACGEKHGDKQVVCKRVVVLRPPEERKSRVSGCQFSHDSKTVEIWRERGSHNDTALPSG